jgi:uncharacterized protein (TIGR02145 family)
MKNFYITLFLLFSSICYSQSPCPGLDSINYSNQWYHTVQIGNQCWLKENLNVGIMKPAVKDQINNDTIEKFCYNNDPAMCDVYGGLYQWREAMQYTLKQGSRGICPMGWHIPFREEFDTLITVVHSDGNALKQIGQGQGTNTSGFSALLSGENEFTSFYYLGNNTNFWSSNFFKWWTGPIGGYNITIWDNNNINSIVLKAPYGISVRCVKNKDELELQSPFGGESWQVGSNHKIIWSGNGITITKIKIEYTTDSGESWLNINNSVPSGDSTYLWTIPNSLSKYCKVRITDLNNTNSIGLSDTVFTINNDPCSGQSTIKYGNKIYNTVNIGGRCWLKENLNIGNMIPGSQIYDTNGVIKKYCYNDDTTNCEIYGGLYPNLGPDICPVYWHKGIISALGNDVLYDGNSLKAVGQGSGFGEGTNLSGFSLLLAGCRWNDGTFQDLGKEAEYPYGLSHSGTGLVNIIFESSSDIGYDAIPTSVGGSIRCVRDDIGSLLLKSPAGGENWLIGSTQKITWTLSNVIDIRIDYSTDNGSNWINIITSTPASAGSYNWPVPNTPSTKCKIKIATINNPDTNSISNVFRIYQVPTNPCPGTPTVNYAGQTYNTIVISEQCWMRENLNIGAMINGTVNQSDNGVIEKYCYNNDTNNCSIYGGLYQWNEAMQYSTTEGAPGICPTGWHIPTWDEFINLLTHVDNIENDLLEIGQGSGTNASGFSALLSGGSSQGNFQNLHKYAYYWNSTNYDEFNAFYSMLISDNNINLGGVGKKAVGSSIRCINDSSVSALPVELTSFTASILNNNIVLKWNTATEINSSFFDVQKKISINNNWQNVNTIKASGNSTSPRNYSYIDKNVEPGKYCYRLKLVDFDGTIKYSKIVEVVVNAPVKYELSNAYPNPVNPSTIIRYQIPINTQVTIKVFDVLGKEVATLVNEVKLAGSYEVTLNGNNLSSGTYFYQMQADKFIESKKFILIK